MGLEPLNCVLIVPMAIPVLCHYLLVLMEAAGADVLVARRVALCFDCALLALYMRTGILLRLWTQQCGLMLGWSWSLVVLTKRSLCWQ